ncbi:MAG TPA: PadR family transcriptional regulator [Clostridia bacterium]|nr:PadR family transcriptional regulator [Clostridia bacterium]
MCGESGCNGHKSDHGGYRQSRYREERCECHFERGGRLLPQYLQAFLLLLLSAKPTHGYELMESLGSFGFTDQNIDPTTIYRHLRRMEEDGLVKSTWDTSGAGPAKRLYGLTPEGEDVLQSWAVVIRHDMKILGTFLEQYDRMTAGSR